jgi:hypothetical protein
MQSKLEEEEIELNSISVTEIEMRRHACSLIVPLKRMRGGVTMSLSLRKSNQEEVRPFVKISTH